MSTRRGWQGGYYNGAVGQHLNYNIVYTTLKALWDSSTGSTTNGPFKADPAEIISSGSDLTNLSQDVISQGVGHQLRAVHPAGQRR